MLLIAIGLSAMAQQRIQLRSVDKAECLKSDMTSLRASFSFSAIEAQDYESERGTFSWLSLPNTVLGGNVGEPQLPVINELIAVPFGTTPRIEITSYSTTDYRLADYDMKTLVPRQLPVRKNQSLEDAPFVMKEEAYQTRGLSTEPKAVVSVDGTMRGVQLGKMTIDPVSYDPVNNVIRVFNDIEVTVHFDGADVKATEEMLLKTYSPAFDAVYAQMFNNKAITDVYSDHPDLYKTPVRILVICYSGFRGNAALNSWLQWKLQKGYYVDIYYTDETGGTTSTAIASFIKTKYNASVSAGNAYTYLIVIGDTGQVPYYMVKNIDSSIGNCASDLGYASVNFSSSTSNYFPDMYYSRMSVENTTHLTNYINKVLTYEKYEFTDGGNYLNNVILVGGYDASWTNSVAKPTINYATNNYFNTSNTTYGGFGSGTIKATISTSSTAGYSGTNNGCYQGINNGVCFLNYTAHGDKQEWYQPKLTATQVGTLTNTGKYFFGVGNCCLTGNFNNTTTDYSPGSAIGTNACFAEAMIRVPNAGAIAYVGCSPYSYWYEDFYWAVGAHSYSSGNAPSVSASSKGVYDVMFMDQYWNSASALNYVGNLAVQQAVTNGNTNSNITDGNCTNSAHYYFQFYHTFGDGSVMPYITKPEANTVTIPSAVAPGTSSITVNAVAGSYVAVTDNSSVIYGVGVANTSGVATVNFTESIPGTGTLYVVVTRQQYQPYFGTINIVGGTQYNITVNPSQHGSVSAPEQAYATTTVTLTATPDAGYCLSAWDVRDANNNSITVTNDRFTMPESDVTVTATFLQGLQVTLASVTHGSISADPLYALQGTTINVTATPAEGYEFGSWLVYKTGDPNTIITVTGNSFTMPNYPVTVSATFVPGPIDLTVYDGTASNQYIPMYGYYFDDYTKSECIIPASALTAMNGSAISAITFYPKSVATSNSTWANTAQTVFLKEVSGTSLGGSFSGTTGATIVKQALLAMPTAGTAYTITFDNPYTYSGGNLLIGVYNTDDGSYNKVEWYGTSGLTSGVSAYGSNSSSLNSVSYNAQSFLPKTTFTYRPSCLEPTGLAASDVTSTSATLSWTENGSATSWVLQYGTNANFTGGTYTQVTVNGASTKVLTGLTAGTQYYARVKAVCDEGNESDWSNVCTFMPTCLKPTGLAATNVAATSATLSWTENGEAGEWLLQYGTDNGFAAGTYTEVNVSGEPVTELVDLTAETQYYARVKTQCGAGNESEWSNTCTFLPTCYLVIGSGTGTNSYLPTNVNNKYSLTQQIYTVAELGEAGYIVSIGFRKNSDAECSRNLEIYMVSTDKSGFTGNNDWVSVTEANRVFSGTVSFADNDWTTITLDRAFSYDGTSNIAIMVDDNTGRAVTSTPFLSFPAGSQALRVCGRTTNYRATSAGSYSGTIEATKNQIRIMKVDYAPLCDAPAGLAVSEIDHQGAMLTWNGEADSWTVSYRPANTEVGTEVTVEEPSYTLTGLEAETSYKVKVAANCGDETVWSEEKGFTTQAAPCTAIVLGDDGAYRENFDNYTTTTTTETGVQPKCWEVYPLSDVSLTASTMPQVYRGFATSGSYSLRMKNRCVYAMPELDENIAIDQLTMTFNLRQPNSIYRLQVGVVNANGAFTLVKTINNAGTGIESVTVDFAEYTGDGHRIAFRNTLGKGSTLSYSYNYIDDIVITSTTATACGIDVLPYPEQFEGYTNTTATETGVQPDCWEVITEDVALSESTKPQLYRGYSTSGDYTLRLKNRCVYAMPEFTTDVSVSDLTMTFNLRQPNSNYRLQVGVLETDGSFTALKTLKSGTSMQSKTVNFSGYTGTGNRIAFRNTLIPGTGMSTDYLDYSINYIDDINLFRTTGKSMEVTAADAGMMGAGRDMLDVMVYPNPTKEFVNVQCTMYNVQCSGIEVVDVYGKVVRTDVGANNDSATQINVSGLAAGMYFVRVTTDKGVVTKPFVKK